MTGGTSSRPGAVPREKRCQEPSSCNGADEQRAPPGKKVPDTFSPVGFAADVASTFPTPEGRGPGSQTAEVKRGALFRDRNPRERLRSRIFLAFRRLAFRTMELRFGGRQIRRTANPEGSEFRGTFSPLAYWPG